MKDEVETNYGFPNVIGIMDSTYIRLAYRPSKHGEDYFCRKQFYSLTALIVCDHNARIMHVSVGFPGSVHDGRVFLDSKIWLNADAFFEAQEYVIADSAFPLSSVCICPYKLMPTELTT